MRFQIKDLLRLTTAWVLLLAVTSINSGVAVVFAIFSLSACATLIVSMLLVLVVGGLKQGSLGGDVRSMLVGLAPVAAATGVVAGVSGFMVWREFGW